MPVTYASRKPYRSVVDSHVLPKVVQLEGNLYGAAFHLMKLLPADFILKSAEAGGELLPGTTVVETTSGTFGLGLAMVCRLRGYPLVLVGDPAIDAPLRRRLEALGARVSIVSGAELRTSGVQQARLDRLARIQSRLGTYFTPGQYDNPLNPVSYGAVAELLLESLGPVDALVCPVGSGGSSSGIGSFLRSLNPAMRLIGVDTLGSVLFGAPAGARRLRGLGNGLLPKVLDHTLFDEVHWLDAPTAFATTRELHSGHCLYMGPTSGAAHHVARWYAREHPDLKVVALFPDEGHRYTSTVYSDTWLRRNDLLPPALPGAPRTLDHPAQVDGAWSHYAWNRQRHEDVTRQAAGGAA
ncbi:cystathionine beta-synthase [Streptomyces sulfonofaciens]|uniref:Cystathionine beta-synthase n=1 Tax=Streptomyces sulfonofaciens TaxID=68272 RepID=A0A919L6F3_9ACTN|nr:pyridoxal-phosphate dependent enzyme [Streptomyces sulfonofaciens]GHH85677.1 cystathionine beta-synthase [Streptomyces sulfonofaciens]